MVDLARSPARQLDRLAKVRGLPRPVEHSHGAEIVAATLRGLSASTDEFERQRPREPSPSQKFRADSLWAVAQILCTSRGIDPDLATSRQETSEFYVQHLSDEVPLRSSPDKRDAPGLLVKFRHLPSVVEPGRAMTLNLRLDIGPPRDQFCRRFGQRCSQNRFNLVKRHLDVFDCRWPLAKPLVQWQILSKLGLLGHQDFLQGEESGTVRTALKSSEN
jgi:hypothetical protein